MEEMLEDTLEMDEDDELEEEADEEVDKVLSDITNLKLGQGGTVETVLPVCGPLLAACCAYISIAYAARGGGGHRACTNAATAQRFAELVELYVHYNLDFYISIETGQVWSAMARSATHSSFDWSNMSSLPFFAFFLALVAADVIPTAPGPNDVFAAGDTCTSQWTPDTTGVWTNMTISRLTSASRKKAHFI